MKSTLRFIAAEAKRKRAAEEEIHGEERSYEREITLKGGERVKVYVNSGKDESNFRSALNFDGQPYDSESTFRIDFHVERRNNAAAGSHCSIEFVMTGNLSMTIEDLACQTAGRAVFSYLTNEFNFKVSVAGAIWSARVFYAKMLREGLILEFDDKIYGWVNYAEMTEDLYEKFLQQEPYEESLATTERIVDSGLAREFIIEIDSDIFQKITNGRSDQVQLEAVLVESGGDQKSLRFYAKSLIPYINWNVEDAYRELETKGRASFSFLPDVDVEKVLNDAFRQPD